MVDAESRRDSGYDAGADTGPPPPCATAADCDDGLVCNGTETCNPAVGCQPGVGIACDDALFCTTDSCVEPGTCRNIAPDRDGDGVGAAGCAAGTDCDDGSAMVFPGATEACNGMDDDCSGMPDDGPGMACALGSAPAACTTACGTMGMRTCTASCALSACAAATETCGNTCDDDGDGMIDEGCSAGGPPNDTCGGATPLAPTGGMLGGTLAGATAQTTDCFSVEVYYSMTLTDRTIVYLDTLGTAFDTAIAYRGTSCSGAASPCVDDSCGTAQTQLAIVAEPGTHYFSVHAYSGATPGPFNLRWQTLFGAGGVNLPITTSGTFTRSTGGASLVGFCGGSLASPEDAYFFTLCPGVSRSIDASTCDPATFYDTVVYGAGPAGGLACNDDDFFCFWDGVQSTTSFTANGPGIFAVYVDGYGSGTIGSSGAYALTISGL
jgi:hypothetical protein